MSDPRSMDVDPRLATIDRRLSGVRRVLAVTGGKGGIGKSSVASTLALLLAERGLGTGLLDLDLTGPSDHVLLGVGDRFPTEESGLEPPAVHGVRFMSVCYFTGESPAPLRGVDMTNALLEILAITRWGGLDALVIDMPPGLGDATLDMVRFLRRAEYLLVGTSSRLVLETVQRTMRFLSGLGVPVLGLIANMHRGDSAALARLARAGSVPLLGELPQDETLEGALGDVPRLLRTPFAGSLRRIAADIMA